MKKMTDEQKAVPLTISIPKYQHDWMKTHLLHGEASKIMSNAIQRRINKETEQYKEN